MNEISSLDLSIEVVPKSDAREWKKISEFALSIPIEEVQKASIKSLHDGSQKLEQLSVTQLRAALYLTQRIINNQSGYPDSFEMEQILKAINLIHQKLQDPYRKIVSS
jgi:hypothetical protein